MHFRNETLIRALKFFELCKIRSRLRERSLRGVDIPSTLRANSRTIPKSRRSPTCAWLILAGILRSPNELRRIVPAPPWPAGLAAAAALTATGLFAAVRPNDADCGVTGSFGFDEFEAAGGLDGAGYGVSEGDDEEASEIGEAREIEAELEGGENVVGNPSEVRVRGRIGMGAEALNVVALPLAARIVCGGDGGCS